MDVKYFYRELIYDNAQKDDKSIKNLLSNKIIEIFFRKYLDLIVCNEYSITMIVIEDILRYRVGTYYFTDFQNVYYIFILEFIII